MSQTLIEAIETRSAAKVNAMTLRKAAGEPVPAPPRATKRPSPRKRPRS